MADPRNPLSLLPSYGSTGSRGLPSNPGATQAAGDVATGLAIAPAVNQSFLNYLAGGIPNYGALTQTESGNIANLLHPTDFTDVQRRAAEQAVAGGYSGSQFGDINALHMTEDEKIRREMLGSQLLSGAAARLPRPFDPSRMLGYGSRTSPGAPAGPVGYMGGPGRGGMPAAPLGSPGDAPAMVLPGTATPHNWLADIISRYSPEGPGAPPLYQTPTGGTGQGSMFMGDIDPETGLPVGDFTGGTPDYQSDENTGPYVGDIPGQPELPDFQDFYA